jgi:hypothetical protein
MTFAAPVEAEITDVATLQAIQDACDRIPREDRHNHRYYAPKSPLIRERRADGGFLVSVSMTVAMAIGGTSAAISVGQVLAALNSVINIEDRY